MAQNSITFICPKSASGGVSDVQQATLTANTSAAFTVGIRQQLIITLYGATDANAAAGVHIRFGFGSNPTAASTDLFIPPGTVTHWYTGDEFDRFAVISAGTPSLTVARVHMAG